jgi:hypothetical protein
MFRQRRWAPSPLRERVGVRGCGLSIECNPSPGSHLSMRHSRSFASASLFKRTAAEGGLRLSRKGRGNAHSRVRRFHFQTAKPSLRAKRSNPWHGITTMDCFVAALLAMTILQFVPNTSPRSRGAMRPSCACLSAQQRAWGMPGANAPAASRAKCRKHTS